MNYLSYLLVLLLNIAILAKPYFIAKCETPLQGKWFGYQDGKMTVEDDGFSGVYPVFIFDDNKNDITVIFDHTKNLSDVWDVKNLPTTRLATIILDDGDKITAVGIYNGAVEMFTFYPKKGVFFYTQHKQLLEIPIKSTFWAKTVYTYIQ
jgi:hypothetical protein